VRPSIGFGQVSPPTELPTPRVGNGAKLVYDKLNLGVSSDPTLIEVKPAEKEHNVKLKVLIYDAEEGGYWAKVPAIPGCVSQGETLSEVKANILDALEGCLSVREETALQEAHVVEEMEV